MSEGNLLVFAEESECRHKQAMKYLYRDMGLGLIEGKTLDECGK